MSKVVIIVGNPQRDSYSEALGKAYSRGAEAGGHHARLFVLSAMTFDPILHEGFRHEQPLESDLLSARAALAAADHIVFIFPLWCGDMPALLKGFFERLLQPDLIKSEASGGKLSLKIFSGKSARVIMTTGMPGWFYRWYYGAHALKLLKRNILNFIGIAPVHSTIYGMIAAADDDKRRKWLSEVEALGHNAA